MFAIYLDLECLLKKEHSWQNNPENHIQKKNQARTFRMGNAYKISFNKKENNLDYYRESDFLDELCKRLKEHADNKK